jgi:hypothetical protein
MFKVTCLANPQRNAGTPRRMVFEILAEWLWHIVS